VANNLIGQAPWELRGANEARIRKLETTTGAPVGVLAQTSVPTLLSGVTTNNSLCSINITVPAGRLIKLRGHLEIASTVDQTGWALEVWEGGSAVTQGTIQSSGANQESIDTVGFISPSAGNHAYSLSLRRFAGTGTATVNAAWSSLVAEDVTPTPPAASSAPSGVLAYAEAPSNTVAASGPETPITGLSATVTVPAGRTIRVRTQVTLANNLGSQQNWVAIKEGTTILKYALASDPLVSNQITLVDEWIGSPSAGTHTYFVAMNATGGTLTAFADADRRSFMVIEDITGSSVTPVSTPNGVGVYSSTTRPPGPWTGMVIFETDTLLAMVWTGSEWRRLTPGGVAWSRYSMAGTSTTSASYVDVPGWLDLSFTKRSASTSLFITLHAGGYMTVAAGGAIYGVRLTSGADTTDKDVCLFFFNDLGTHRSFSGSVGGYSGLAAGTYAMRLRWKTGGGTSQLNFDGNDLFSLRVEEIVGM
jgi:hypothetical protein